MFPVVLVSNGKFKTANEAPLMRQSVIEVTASVELYMAWRLSLVTLYPVEDNIETFETDTAASAPMKARKKIAKIVLFIKIIALYPTLIVRFSAT